MNPIIAKSLAQEHADTLLANAAASRRVREARRARRSSRHSDRRSAADTVAC